MLNVTTSEHLPQIAAWIKADPFHEKVSENNPEFLLTGNGEISFRVEDKLGTVFFFRLDKEGDLLRWAGQFGPREEVSKRRLVIAMLREGLPFIIAFARKNGYKGVVFESVNPPLIAFLGKQGFKSVGDADYQLTIEDNTHV